MRIIIIILLLILFSCDGKNGYRTIDPSHVFTYNVGDTVCVFGLRGTITFAVFTGKTEGYDFTYVTTCSEIKTKIIYNVDLIKKCK